MLSILELPIFTVETNDSKLVLAVTLPLEANPRLPTLTTPQLSPLFLGLPSPKHWSVQKSKRTKKINVWHEKYHENEGTVSGFPKVRR